MLKSLVSLRSLQLASISFLIFIRATFFLSALSCHREDKKWAILQTREKFRSSGGRKLSERTLLGVRSGRIVFSPFRSTVDTPLFSLHSNMACSSVSTAWGLHLHLVHNGDWLGRILETLSAVGKIWWSSLKRNVARAGSSLLFGHFPYHLPVVSWLASFYTKWDEFQDTCTCVFF